jgi:hypothetical protein
MNITELKERNDISENVKLNRLYTQFQKLLKELKERELPEKIIETINKETEDINSTYHIGKDLRELIIRKQTKVLNFLKKEIKIVPKNHYRNLWGLLGVSFGTSIGLIIGVIIGNIGVYGIGLPICMAVGILLGSKADKKAFNEGRQLGMEIKY